MARFRSRYASYTMPLPPEYGGRTLRFTNGLLDLDEELDPQAVALVRAICKAEAKSNAAVQELDAAGHPLPHTHQGYGPAGPPAPDPEPVPTSAKTGKRPRKKSTV